MYITDEGLWMYWFPTDSRVYRHSAMIYADKANQALGKRRKIKKLNCVKALKGVLTA